MVSLTELHTQTQGRFDEIVRRRSEVEQSLAYYDARLAELSWMLDRIETALSEPTEALRAVTVATTDTLAAAAVLEQWRQER